MLRCMPWWDGYYEARLALGDRKTPALDGFHYLLRGIELPKVTRLLVSLVAAGLGWALVSFLSQPFYAARRVCAHHRYSSVQLTLRHYPTRLTSTPPPPSQLYRAGWTGNYERILEGLTLKDRWHHLWNQAMRPKLAAFGITHRWSIQADSPH